MAEKTQYWNQLISDGIRFLQEQNNDDAAAVLREATFDVEHSYHDSWRWGTDYWALVLYLKHADYTALGEGKEQLEKDIMSALVTLQKGSKDLLSTVSIRPLAEENTERPEVLPLQKAVVDAEPFLREGTLKAYALLSNDKTFAFSAENPTGARGGGSRGGDCTKLSPTVTIHAGETVTLAEVEGSGLIQNMWFTGYVGHSFILRMYWDDQDYPSVEAPLSAFFGCAYDEKLC